MRSKLTDAAIRRLASPSRPQTDYWDSGWRLPGSFGLRVSRTGVKSWRYVEFLPVYDPGSTKPRVRKRAHTLGRWPEVTLSDALDAAERIARRRHVGPGRTVSHLAERALAKLEAGKAAPATMRTRSSCLRLHVLPYIGKMRDHEVTTPILQELVDRQQLAKRMGTARDLVSTLRMLFADSTSLGLDFNPALGLSITKHDRVRRIAADVGVLVRVWHAAESMIGADLDTSKLALAIQLQIASLQRTQAVLSLHRDHLSTEWWIHPGSFSERGREYRTKRAQETAVPLVGLVRETVDRALALSPDPFPFATGHKRMPGVSFLPNFMDALRERAKLTATEWRPHDTRKLGATALDRLGVPLDHYQRVLSHSRPRSVTVTHYVIPDRRDPVLRDVLEKWSAHLRPLLSAAPSVATSPR